MRYSFRLFLSFSLCSLAERVVKLWLYFPMFTGTVYFLHRVSVFSFHFQQMQNQLDIKRPLVEQCLEAGRFYLREEGHHLSDTTGKRTAFSSARYSHQQSHSLRLGMYVLDETQTTDYNTV